MTLVENLKKKAYKRLNEEQALKLKLFVGRNPIIGAFVGAIFGRNLTKLAIVYNTDKWSDVSKHYYTPHYQQHLKKFKYKKINLLEIGVGGYDLPERGGNSLRMWNRYFPFGRIFSLDIYDKSPHQQRRIKIFKGSQVDYNFLDNIVEQIKGPIDVIIDDGSHINEHVICTFKHLFPKLKPGGIYVVEDTQTSYWKDYGGDNTDFQNPGTMMNFFKNLVDCVNYKEFQIENYVPTYYDKNIASIHFYHNLIFIYKQG
jgi:hypothetical protein